MTNKEEHPTRSGFVALVGAPNAGKSTLANRLVGTKISIVTHKVQTTRTPIHGIAVQNNTQIVVLDTPGIFLPEKRLGRAMVSTAWASVRSADILMAIIDAQVGYSDVVDLVLSGIKATPLKKILILNKIDRVNRSILLALTKRINDQISFEKTFMVSALNGSGCTDILKYLEKTLPENPWYYPEDQISDMTMRQFSAEITREKLFLRLHDELPYASSVETERWEDRKDGSVRIEQTIYVERESHKKILLGHRGSTIKAIGQASRKELSRIMERPVHLFLFAKVRENWSNDPERYNEMGLVFSD